MGTLSSPTKVKNIYQRLAFWTSDTRQVALDQGKDLADAPLFRPQMDISAFGITGNLAGTDQAAFEAALTAAAGTTLVIDKPVSITANTTIGATNTLHFTRSGRLSVADGIKLVFTNGCEFNDTIHQIFDFDGVVKIEGVINHSFWRPEWFGAMPDTAGADFGRIINEMFTHCISPSTTTGWFPTVFRFRNTLTYYTDEPVKYRAITEEITQSDGINYEDAESVNVVDASGLPSASTIYMWTDIDRWARIEYTGKSGNTLTGCVWSVYHGLSDDYADVSDGASVRRGTSRMNDFIMESESRGSRFAGAVLKSNLGLRVIDGSHETCGYLVARCVFRGIRFAGKGDAGALQTEYVAYLSAIDLLHMDSCAILYCNYGWYFNHGGAGAAMVTDSFIVNYGSNLAINGMGNCKFQNCIIEQCSLLVGGNNTDPVSFMNCHIEHVAITASGRFELGGGSGTTNSVIVTLLPNTSHSDVWIREVGSYLIDHGHYNRINGGFRFAECEGVTSSVVNMGFPSTRDCGTTILQKNVPYLLSVGISLDGATPILPATWVPGNQYYIEVPTYSDWVSLGSYTIGDFVEYFGTQYVAVTTHSGSTTPPPNDTTNWLVQTYKTHVVHNRQIFHCIVDHSGESTAPRFDTTNWELVGPYTDYDFALLDYSTADQYGRGYETYIDYGTIAAGRNTSRFTPIQYKQEWACVVPDHNVFLQPSHLCNLKVTRPKNLTPMFRFSDASVSSHNWRISGWYAYSGLRDNGPAGSGLYDDNGKVRMTTSSAAGGPYIALSYGQLIKLEMGKTYVAVMRGTKNAGTKLPQLCVGANMANPGVEYQSQEPIDIGGGVYEAVCMFRPKDNRPTVISFGHLTDPGDMDFTFDFVAVAELGNYTKFTSDGLPEVGVFFNGDAIIDEKPTTNGASLHICTTETAGNYGAVDVGCALNAGAWVSAASYTKGDCVSYSSVVYHARTTHTGVATLPSADTTNWAPMERIDAEGQYVPDGNALFTTV